MSECESGARVALLRAGERLLVAAVDYHIALKAWEDELERRCELAAEYAWQDR